MLDVDASDKGLLVPGVSLTSTTDNVTIVLTATSLLVYNIAVSGSYPDDIVPGFYYWDGTRWKSMNSPVYALSFADFYALMPPDNAVTVAVGAGVSFPNTGTLSGLDIVVIDDTRFQLSTIGTYMISWVVSISEPSQLVIEINGIENLSTVVGSATATDQNVGTRLITTTSANSILRIVNPISNFTALTITPFAGGASPVSASLIITLIK